VDGVTVVQQVLAEDGARLSKLLSRAASKGRSVTGRPITSAISSTKPTWLTTSSPITL